MKPKIPNKCMSILHDLGCGNGFTTQLRMCQSERLFQSTLYTLHHEGRRPSGSDGGYLYIFVSEWCVHDLYTNNIYNCFFMIAICSRHALLLVPPVAFFSSTARS